jgi:ribosomal protein S18 acetylase RimI-like enzyme
MRDEIAGRSVGAVDLSRMVTELEVGPNVDRMPTVRRASELDVDALVPLKASVHALHVARRPDVFKSMTNDEFAEWLRERLADESTHVWIAEDEGKAVGYLLAARRRREETPFSLARQWCEIDAVFVAVNHRQSGVARALLERAIAHAQDSGLETIELTAWAFNEPARAAFQRMGFEPMLLRYELGRR